MLPHDQIRYIRLIFGESRRRAAGHPDDGKQGLHRGPSETIQVIGHW